MLFGIAAGTLLIQTRTNFLPKAEETYAYPIKVYLIYPSDKPEIPEYSAAVRNYISSDFENYFRTKVGVKPNTEPLQIIKSSKNYLQFRCGPQPTEECKNDPTKIPRGANEYIAETGGMNNNTIKLVFAPGMGGYAGANFIPGTKAGYAMVGDFVLESLSSKVNPWGIPCSTGDGWECEGGRGKATPIHELGHGVGVVGHTGNSIMNDGYQFPDISFLPDEISFLRKSPFFTVVSNPPTAPTQTIIGKCLLSQVRAPGNSSREDVSIDNGTNKEFCDVNNKMYRYRCEEGVPYPTALPDKDKECITTPTQGAPAAGTAPKKCDDDNLKKCPTPNKGCYMINDKPRCVFEKISCTETEHTGCKNPPDPRPDGCEVKDVTIDGQKLQHTQCTPAKTGTPAAGAPTAPRTNTGSGTQPAAGATAPRPAAGPEANRAQAGQTNVANTTRPQAELICGKDEKGVEIPCYAMGVFSPNELSDRVAQTTLASVNYSKFRSIIDEQEKNIGAAVANNARAKIDAAEKEVKACLEKK